MSELALLQIDAETMFRADSRGRVVADGSPERGPGPRLYVGGSAEGNLLRLRRDVSVPAASRLERLVADAPPLVAAERAAALLAVVAAILGMDAPVTRHETGLVYVLPHGSAYSNGAALVRSGTPAGEALLAGIVHDGMPAGLRDAGFVGVDEFWPPWCIALDGGDVAAIAFAARLGERGAEAGLNTVAAKRGRGFGAAATAGWAAHPVLADRALFYSTTVDNGSSQRVAQRLGLRLLGVSLSVT